MGTVGQWETKHLIALAFFENKDSWKSRSVDGAVSRDT